MTVTGTLPHASTDWRMINWRQICRGVRRLQMRIAEAMRAENDTMTGSPKGALKGLSRMIGNFHVRFLGGRVDW